MKSRAKLYTVVLVSLFGCGTPASPLFLSKTGAVSVTHPQPENPEWTWKALDRVGDGFELEEIKWALGTPPALMLYAKDYHSKDANNWNCSTDALAGLFATATIPLSATPARMLNHEACRLEGSGLIDGREMTIVEYRITVPDHQLVLSAAGSPDRVGALAAEIQSWFARVQFKSLSLPP